MSAQIWFRRGLVLGLLGIALLLVWWPPASTAGEAREYLSVRFLDVGQGDAIHIMTPDGYELLVDGGPSASVLRELAAGRSFFDHDIDVLVATHPDSDHVSGLVDVLERYTVGLIIESGVTHDAAAAAAFERAVAAEAAPVIAAAAGQVVQLGASTTVRILSPRGDTTNWQSNNASVVLQIIYGESSFLLTGDAPTGIEDFLVQTYGAELDSDVLKLGHHGSDTASGQSFLDAVTPAYAVVSAGVANRYGHPHQAVLARVAGVGARLVGTAEQGTIEFLSDGKTIWIQ